MFYDLWRLFDLCLLEGSTERDADLGNRLWALLCDGGVNKMESASPMIEKQT